MKDKRNSYLWVRNTSRYSMEEVWPLAKLAYEAASQKRCGHLPRIIIKLTNSSSAYCGRAFWTEWHSPSHGQTREAGRIQKIPWRRILCRIGAPCHFPAVARYPRFKDMPEYPIGCHREGLAFIIAHEMEHAFGTPGGKDGEIRCELAAQDAVDLYRASKGDVDAEIFDAITDDLGRSLNRRNKRRAAASPEAKAQKVDAQLKRWKRKLKLAQGKVKKYERTLRRIQKAPVQITTEPLALAASGQAHE